MEYIDRSDEDNNGYQQTAIDPLDIFLNDDFSWPVYDEEFNEVSQGIVDVEDAITEASWVVAVEKAMETLKDQNRTKHHFSQSVIFLQQFNTFRYTVKCEALVFMHIFPWFHIPPSAKDHRYRESLKKKSNEKIEKVIEDLNFIWNFPFKQTDYLCLQECYLSMNLRSIRPLWSIVQLRCSFERNRLRHAYQLLDSCVMNICNKTKNLTHISRGTKRNRIEEDAIDELCDLTCEAVKLSQTVYNLVQIHPSSITLHSST